MRRIAKNLTLRLTAEEYEQLRLKAEERGLKIEPTVRALIAEQVLVKHERKDYTSALKELNRIGRQINQIAFQANSRKEITDSEIKQAVYLTQQVYALIENIV